MEKTHCGVLYAILILLPLTAISSTRCGILLEDPPRITDLYGATYRVTKVVYSDHIGELGSLEYSIGNAMPHLMTVASVITDFRFRKQRISTNLIRAAVAREKDVLEIMGLLVGTNFQVFATAYVKNLNCVEAFKTTPFYRSFSSFGFAMVKDCRHLHDTVYVTLTRHSL